MNPLLLNRLLRRNPRIRTVANPAFQGSDGNFTNYTFTPNDVAWVDSTRIMVCAAMFEDNATGFGASSLSFIAGAGSGAFTSRVASPTTSNLVNTSIWTREEPRICAGVDYTPTEATTAAMSWQWEVIGISNPVYVAAANGRAAAGAGAQTIGPINLRPGDAVFWADCNTSTTPTTVNSGTGCENLEYGFSHATTEMSSNGGAFVNGQFGTFGTFNLSLTNAAEHCWAVLIIRDGKIL